MSEVTRLLEAAKAGQAGAADELLELVYDELRQLAAQKLARESPGSTLQPTALVHEAWVRLAGPEQSPRFDNRAHFFGAAAEAMRRILVDRARRRKVLEKGGYATREEWSESIVELATPADELIDVDGALNGLAQTDAEAAQLVKLRYFVGMSMPEAAEVLGMSQRSAERLWTYARAWLRTALDDEARR